MRLRLAPLINNPQPSQRCIGAMVTGTVLTGGIAIMGTIGHTAITGTITVRIGAAGLGIGRIAIMGITIVHTATAGIGVTGAAGNREPI